MPATPPPPSPVAGRTGRRPHPRWDQFKRTWYFFRRNTLAMVGLGIIVAIVGVAAYSSTLPLPWITVPAYCNTNYGPQGTGSGYPGNFTGPSPGCIPVCTYEVTPPPNAAQYCGGQWYKTPYHTVGTTAISYPGVLPPTLTLAPFSTGPMPLGDLTLSVSRATPVFNVFTSLERGSDWSLIFSGSIVGLGALVGLLVGSIAGFYGGLIDDVLMRIVDVFLSIPQILFVIVVVTVVLADVPGIHGPAGYDVQLGMIILGFMIVWWPLYARIVRGQVLVVREQKYVEAAQASGASKGRILRRHIIPNSMYPIFIQFSLDVGTIPLLIGALVYLGFGPTLFPNVGGGGPFPEWGAISAASVADLPVGMLGSCFNGPCVIAWWQLFFPGLCLFFYAIAVNLLADGLRDSLDPRLRR